MTDPSAGVLSSLSSAVASVVARATPSIVSVHSHRSRASGFVWKPGLVVTADEALAEEGEISIKLADGTARSGSIVGRDHTTDIALVRFDAKDIAPIKLSPEVPALGALSIVVAAERGTPAAALGITSLTGGRWRSLRGGDIDARIELDVRLRHSHQGGLALNAAGEPIGMAVLGARSCRGQTRNPWPDRARLSRGWPSAGQTRRRHRRDGDERRQDRPIGCRRHPAR